MKPRTIEVPVVLNLDSLVEQLRKIALEFDNLADRIQAEQLRAGFDDEGVAS